MKKLIYCAAALVTALFAGSCQRELLDPAAQGNTVTFTVEIPEVATKATVVDDGTNINNLVYAVYRTDESNLADAAASIDPTKLVYRVNPKAQGKVTAFSDGKTNVTLELINNQKYIILFWAQVNQTWVTGTEFDLTNITYPSKLTANQNKYEAFCGAAFVDEVTGATKKSVTLTRPFAQINLASTDPANYDVDIVSSSVKIENVYPKFNVATKKAFGDEFRTVVYADNANPDGNFGNYDHHVAMNYIFANPKNDGTTPVKVTCTINTASHGLGIKKEISNVPVAQNYRTNIVGNLLTSDVDYNVTLDKEWAGAEITVANTTEAVQAALDNAVAGTTIQLEPGVNYGTLYLRPSANVDVTKEVDWVGNNYRYETYSLFENITIKGAEGATVDAIEIEGGTYYNSEHSQADKYPIMLSLIELKNVVIDGVTFTGQGGYDPQGHGNAINLSGNNIKVDGLTIQNCTLNNQENNARLIYKTESTTTVHKYTYDDQTKALQEYTFTPSLKNITVTGTTFNGGYIGLELRETENVTITNNTFNVEDRNILLPVNSGCTYSGKVTITGNVSNDAKQRFVRMSGAGDAEVVITANTINNYQGADADYIKVEGGNNVTIENNVLGVSTAEDLQYILNIANGTANIKFNADIDSDVTVAQKQGVKIIIDGNGKEYNGSIKVHSNSNYYADAALTIKNVNFETSAAGINVIEALENGSARYSQNITVDGCTFTATGEAVNTSVAVQVKATRGVTVTGCTATNMHSLIQAQSCDTGDVKVVNCTVNGKNGVAFKQVKSATVEGTTITALEYGIRFDGNIDNYGITVKDNTVSAGQPLIVRKMTGQNNTITLEGTNTLTTEAEYQIVITNGSDDEAYVKPTGTYELTGADGYTVFPAPFPVASWDEFTAALAAGEDYIKLTANIEYASNYQLQKIVKLDLGGNSMTLPMINIHTKTTIKNGTINGNVYARNNSEIVFNNVKFSGAVADNLSTEGHLAIQGGCKSLYAKDCLFSPTSVSGSQTKPLSFEGGSTIMKFENCEFKSSPYKKQVYFNPLSATGSLDFTNCNFNTKTPNIMFAAACPLTNITMSGTTKLSSVTFEINRAKEAVTDADLAYLRTLIANNSFSSVRLFYAGGSSEYIR